MVLGLTYDCLQSPQLMAAGDEQIVVGQVLIAVYFDGLVEGLLGLCQHGLLDAQYAVVHDGAVVVVMLAAELREQFEGLFCFAVLGQFKGLAEFIGSVY